MQSIVQQRGTVTFPTHTGERIYMREFTKRFGLPADIFRWQETVDAMLDGIDVDGPIYLMVDQGYVRGGKTHRRPGMHIDGYWVPAIHAHHNPVPHHSVTPSRRDGMHIHAGSHDHGRHIHDRNWPIEAIILASDVSACRAVTGVWDGVIGEGGDCSHIDVSGMSEVVMQAGNSYAGNVTMLHESLPIAHDCLRTVVRLNVPGWAPSA